MKQSFVVAFFEGSNEILARCLSASLDLFNSLSSSLFLSSFFSSYCYVLFLARSTPSNGTPLYKYEMVAYLVLFLYVGEDASWVSRIELAQVTDSETMRASLFCCAR